MLGHSAGRVTVEGDPAEMLNRFNQGNVQIGVGPGGIDGFVQDLRPIAGTKAGEARLPGVEHCVVTRL